MLCSGELREGRLGAGETSRCPEKALSDVGPSLSPTKATLGPPGPTEQAVLRPPGPFQAGLPPRGTRIRGSQNARSLLWSHTNVVLVDHGASKALVPTTSSVTHGTSRVPGSQPGCGCPEPGSEAPGARSPTPPAAGPGPAPHGPPPAPRPPVCVLTDPVISGEHTQEVRQGRAHPRPDLHGTEHKKPPFLAREEPPCPTPPSRKHGSDGDSSRRAGRTASGGTSGSWQEAGSLPGPGRQRWRPRPGQGLHGVRYGRGGRGRAGSRQSEASPPPLPGTMAPVGCAPAPAPVPALWCHPTVLPPLRGHSGSLGKGTR